MNDQSQWLRYIESQIGFILPSTQLQWLSNAVNATAYKYELSTTKLWEKVQKDDEIRRTLIDSIMIIESRFFRHKASIDFVTNVAFENNNKDNERFTVWSVGCSEGQEPWSLVMSLSKVIENFHVFGTDISSKAIKIAKSATYPKRHVKNIPNEYLGFIEETESLLRNSVMYTEKKWKVTENIHSYASFFLHNIFFTNNKKEHPDPLLIKHDVIFCQNMLIYFRQFDQRDILSRLVNQCKIGGYIILAPNEAYFWKHPQMQRVESEHVNAWKKIK